MSPNPEYLKNMVQIDEDGNTVIKGKLLCDGKKYGVPTSVFSHINEPIIEGNLPTCLKSDEVIVSEKIYGYLTERQNFYASKDNFISLGYDDKPYPIAGKLEVTLLESEYSLGSSNILIRDLLEEAHGGGGTVLYTSQFRKQRKKLDELKPIDILVLDSRNRIELSNANLPIVKTKDLLNKIRETIADKSIFIQANNFHIQEIMYEINQKFKDIKLASTPSLFEQAEIFRNNKFEIPLLVNTNNSDEWNQLVESKNHYIVFAQRYQGDSTVLSDNYELHDSLEKKIKDEFHCMQIFENQSDYQELEKRRQNDEMHIFEEDSDEDIICPNHIELEETYNFIEECDPMFIIVDNSSRTCYGEPFAVAIQNKFKNKTVIAKPMKNNS